MILREIVTQRKRKRLLSSPKCARTSAKWPSPRRADAFHKTPVQKNGKAIPFPHGPVHFLLKLLLWVGQLLGVTCHELTRAKRGVCVTPIVTGSAQQPCGVFDLRQKVGFPLSTGGVRKHALSHLRSTVQFSGQLPILRCAHSALATTTAAATRTFKVCLLGPTTNHASSGLALTFPATRFY
jgi:hypothetical protein